MSEAPPSPGSGPKIFVSYRRGDCAGHAGRLYDQLCERFGERQVFMDIDAIRPGEDFTKALTQAVNSSNVFLAIIGKRWLSGAHQTASRLDDPDDFVRFEIAAALKAGILVIPVLMEKASMPHAEDLPAELLDFTRRNAIDVSDARFRYDVKRLIEVIESVAPATASAGSRIGPYRLVSKLGRGAFGVVWLAEKQTALAKTRVALKTPNEEDVDLLAVKAEAEIWIAAGGHPNIHPIIDADIYDGRMVIVSEYAPDGSLQQWLQRSGGKAASIDSAIRMTDGILAGLEHLHGRDIIHRDLKPDNILLQGDNPRLADFGIARMLKDVKTKTQTAGSPWYLAPEAFRGQRSVQTDLWAVGVLLYQLVSGRLPFAQTDAPSVMNSVLNEPFAALPPSVPASLKEVIGKALEKNSTLRFASAGDMRRALRAAQRSVLAADDIATVVPDADAIQTLRLETSKKSPWQNITVRRRNILFSIAILSLVIVAIFFWSRNWRKVEESRPPNANVETNISKRVFTYFLHPKDAVDERFTGNEQFHNGSSFTLVLTPEQSGSLYLINKGGGPQGHPVFNVLFPTPKNNSWSSSLTAHQSLAVGINFDLNSGDEDLTIIWVTKPIPELERIAKDAASTNFEIKNPDQVRTVAEFLDQQKSSSTNVEVDSVKKDTTVRGENDVLLTTLVLKHRDF